MKATKQTLQVTVEILDTASVHFMIEKMLSLYDDSVLSGELVMLDGDTITWETNIKEVNI